MPTPPIPATTPATPSLRQALGVWLKIGCLGFGGPAGQIALMHAEVVERRQWIDDQRFVHALNYCMVLPGPEAQQLATYLGWLLHRTRGAIAAGVLFILPGWLLITLLAWAYLHVGSVPVIAGALTGLKAAVVVVIAQACVRLARKVLLTSAHRLLALMALAALLLFNAPFPLVIIAAGLFGWVTRHQRQPAVDVPPATAATGAHTPLRPWRLFAVGAALWLLPLLLLMLIGGVQGTPAQMAWFFTQTALIGFGGAYAILPYVQQAAVSHYGWLAPAQVMDGLALGETTPGPLILVIIFVGFVGGFQHPVPALGPHLSGWLAALVAGWYSFLPSFLFILAGAPWVERTRNLRAVAAPLAAISAAIVGVIANLGLFFATHLWWPQGLSAPVDPNALLLTGLAGVLLFGARWRLLPLLGVCCGAGAARAMVDAII